MSKGNNGKDAMAVTFDSYGYTQLKSRREAAEQETQMDSVKNARFRELLNRPGLVAAGVAYDALSARILDQAGFELLAMGGNSTMASLIGYPDLGIATQTEMIGRARLLAARVDAPMYCDADTGYGDLPSIRRTVVDYEAAGVSGIHLEDQTMPKKCGAMAGVTVIPLDQMLDKIKVAVNSRKDPNFIIIARTDCYNTMGIDESIRRCKLFYEAGADVVMPENIKTKAEWAKLGREMARCGIPAMIDLIDDDQISWSNKECEEMGFKIACRGMYTILAVTQFLKDLAEDYKKTGSAANYVDKCMNIRDYEKILGIEKEQNIRELIK